MKKKVSLFLFSSMLFVIPLLSNLSTSMSDAWAIAGIYADSNELQAGAVVIETGAGIAFALGAICPPQWVAFAVVGA